MTTPRRVWLAGLVLAAIVAGSRSGPVLAQGAATYLYSLSSFSGPLRDDSVRVVADADADETYVIYQNRVRIYGPSGMEVFSFGEDLDVGQILDLAVDKDGSIILLSFKDANTLVTRCDFRGSPVGPFQISNLPQGLVFGANRIIRRGDVFYFASLPAWRVILTDEKGAYRSQVDLRPLIQADPRPKEGAEIIGFTIDADGSMYFTVVSSFGKSGSTLGQFGVVAGIATDDRGHLFVSDKLKCAVLVFDRDFNAITEFGYRGPRPENLIAPDDIATDRHGRIFVAQVGRRGVSVFSLVLP